VFVAASVTAATRAGMHLAADALAQHYSLRALHRIRQLGALLGLVPWALFVLVASKAPVLGSLQQAEAFGDTGVSSPRSIGWSRSSSARCDGSRCRWCCCCSCNGRCAI
jgi:hypothetical protein